MIHDPIPGERQLCFATSLLVLHYPQVAHRCHQLSKPPWKSTKLAAKKTTFGPRKVTFQPPCDQFQVGYFQSPQKISPGTSAWKRKHVSLRPQPPCGQGFTGHGWCILQKSKVSTHHFPANCSKHTSCLAFKKNLTSHTTSWDTKNYHILKEFKPSFLVYISIKFPGCIVSIFSTNLLHEFMESWYITKCLSCGQCHSKVRPALACRLLICMPPPLNIIFWVLFQQTKPRLLYPPLHVPIRK